MIEQTLSIIKPDAIERNLENNIKNFFEKNFQKKKHQNFIKCIKQNRFMVVYAIIYHQDL